MKNAEKNLIYEYMLNNRTLLANDYLICLEMVRFRSFDITDLVELLVAKIRYDSFLEFSGHITELMKMCKRYK